MVFGLVMLNAKTAALELHQAGKNNSCKVLRSMARVYMAGGDYAKAQPLAENALTLARKNDNSDPELCLCLIDLAYLYKNQGKFDDAESMC